jgi:hypothetical protein
MPGLQFASTSALGRILGGLELQISLKAYYYANHGVHIFLPLPIRPSEAV